MSSRKNELSHAIPALCAFLGQDNSVKNGGVTAGNSISKSGILTAWPQALK
jgi:hypothetical protein